MSDELIQQVPQQGNYAIPGLIGGGVVGAVGGALAANRGYGWTTKPNLDEVFAQKPDTFKRQIEKGGENKASWETAQEWAKKIQDSEAEYDKKLEELKKGGNIATNVEELADSEQAKKDYKAAKNAYDTALEAEKKAIAKNNKVGEFKFPTADEVKNLGDRVTLKEVKEYENLLESYNNALETARTNADKTKLNQFKINVANHLEGIDNLSKQPKGFFSRITRKDAIEKRVNLIRDEIKNMPGFQDITDPKRIQYELKVAGKDYKPGSKNYKKFVNQLNEQVRADREALLNEILGEKTQVDIIDPKTKKVIGKRTTYTNVEAFIHEGEAARNRITKFENRPEVKKIGGAANLDTVENYEKQLEYLEKNRKKMTVGAYEKRKKALETEKKLAEDFQKIKESLQNRANNFFGKISHTKTLEQKVERAIMNDSQVQSTLQKLRNFANKNDAIKDIAFNVVEEGEMTAEEIAEKAAKNLEDQKVAENLKKAEDAVNARLKELGKGGEMTTEEAVKKLGTKQEFTKAVKDDAKKAVEPLLEKLKLPHVGKTAAAAGVILALAGLGIGAAAKKDLA